MALYRRKPNVIEAVQFDAHGEPLPSDITVHQNVIGGRGHGRIPIGLSYQCAGQPIRDGDWIDRTDAARPRVIPIAEFRELYEPFGAHSYEEHARRQFSLMRHKAGCLRHAVVTSGAKDLIGFVVRVSCADCPVWFEVGPNGYQQQSEELPFRINRPYDTEAPRDVL